MTDQSIPASVGLADRPTPTEAPLYIARVASRFAAAAIDVALNGLILVVLLFWARSFADFDSTGQTQSPVGGALLLCSLATTYYVVHGLRRRGATLGMRAMNIRVVSRRNRALPTLGQAFARFVLTWVLSTPALLGLLLAGADREHRSWYDHATGTVVIRV